MHLFILNGSVKLVGNRTISAPVPFQLDFHQCINDTKNQEFAAVLICCMMKVVPAPRVRPRNFINGKLNGLKGENSYGESLASVFPAKSLTQRSTAMDFLTQILIGQRFFCFCGFLGMDESTSITNFESKFWKRKLCRREKDKVCA